MVVRQGLGGIPGKISRAAILRVIITLFAATSARAETVTITLAHHRLSMTQRGARTVLTLVGSNKRQSVTLPAEAMITAGTFLRARLLGTSGRFAVIETTYASQTGVGGPQAQCAAGEETILRVVKTSSPFKQTDTLRIASCWMNIYEAESVWVAKTREVIVGSDADDARRYRLTDNGGLKRWPKTTASPTTHPFQNRCHLLVGECTLPLARGEIREQE